MACDPDQAIAALKMLFDNYDEAVGYAATAFALPREKQFKWVCSHCWTERGDCIEVTSNAESYFSPELGRWVHEQCESGENCHECGATTGLEVHIDAEPPEIKEAADGV